MTERPGYSGTDLFLAILGGAAMGAAVALLTAPRSGRETRHRLTDVMDTGKEKAKHFPTAMKNASVAAREAFVAEMNENARV